MARFAPAPLFEDPIPRGPTDPTVIRYSAVPESTDFGQRRGSVTRWAMSPSAG